MRNAERNLLDGQQELDGYRFELQRRQAAFRTLVATNQQLRATEVQEARRVDSLQGRAVHLEQQLGHLEAKLQTQLRRHRQERLEWQQRLRRLERPEVPEVQREVVDLRAVGEKKALEEHVSELTESLRLREQQRSLDFKAQEAQREADEQRRELLGAEIGSARGQVKALAQQLSRLREAARPPKRPQRLEADVRPQMEASTAEAPRRKRLKVKSLSTRR